MTQIDRPQAAPAVHQSQQRPAPTSLLPGLALGAAGAATALVVNWFLPAVSPLLVAILLGALVANLGWVPPKCAPGIRMVARPVLRVGIALLGFQLLLSDILGLGWQTIVLVVVIVAAGIVGTLWFGSLMGVPRTQRLLIACGFSICGAAAVAAAEDVSGAEEEDVLTAIALVVLFGTVMIGAVPLLSSLFGLSDVAAGMWTGGSVHEVAQVIAVGGILGGTALAVATVVKLARVLLLAPVIAILGFMRRRELKRAEHNLGTVGKRPPIVPMFIVAFLACVTLRSSGIVPDTALAVAGFLQAALLSAAMFALGLGVKFAALRTVGPRPLALAAVSTAWVAGIALVGVLVTVPGAIA